MMVCRNASPFPIKLFWVATLRMMNLSGGKSFKELLCCEESIHGFQKVCLFLGDLTHIELYVIRSWWLNHQSKNNKKIMDFIRQHPSENAQTSCHPNSHGSCFYIAKKRNPTNPQIQSFFNALHFVFSRQNPGVEWRYGPLQVKHRRCCYK